MYDAHFLLHPTALHRSPLPYIQANLYDTLLIVSRCIVLLSTALTLPVSIQCKTIVYRTLIEPPISAAFFVPLYSQTISKRITLANHPVESLLSDSFLLQLAAWN